MRTRILALVMLFLLGIPALVSAQETPITVGETITGEITNEKPADTYTLVGTAGDTVVITMNAIGQGLDPYLTVTAPDGSVSHNDDSNASLNSTLPLVLSVDGTYTIVASRCCGDRSQSGSEGAYELRVSSVSMNRVTPGETITLEVNPDQPSVYVALSGTPGQILRVEAEKTGGDASFTLDARDPSGMMVNSAIQQQDGRAMIDPLFVNQAGQYLLTISRQIMYPDNAPSGERVSVQIRPVAVETQPIAIGDTVSGVLDDANPSVYYTFDATTSDLLRVTGSRPEGSGEFEAMLFNSNGMGFGGNGTAYSMEPGSFSIDPLQLTESGTFLIVVRRAIMPDQQEILSAEYTLALEPTQTPLLEIGVAVEGSFDGSGYENIYRYEGVAGQTLRITLNSLTDNYAPAMSVQGPQIPTPNQPEGYMQTFYAQISGNTTARATYEVTLPVDGSYIFRVGNGMYNPEGVVQGSYSLLIEVVQ